MAALKRWWTIVIVVVVLDTLPGYSAYAGPACAAAVPCACPWAGIYSVVLTPFCAGGVDEASLAQQIQYQLHGGVNGFLVLGTIGEGQYTTLEERAQVIATAVRVACGKPVIAGIHTCRLDEAIAQVLQAHELGASAVLVKYLGNPHAAVSEVFSFYAALCDLHALPIFYYHYPSETGLKLTAEEVAAVLNLEGMAGIKESTLNLPEEATHIRLTHKAVLTSTALNLTQVLELGGQGAMCPEAVLLPGPTVQVYDAYVHGRHDEARALQKELFATVPITSTRRTPPALVRVVEMSAADHTMALPLRPEHPQAQMKVALDCLGVPMSAAVKCPLPPLTERERKKVEATVSCLKTIDWSEAAFRTSPLPPQGTEERPGYLLHTGAIQLGPWVGRNWWGWQGDGQGWLGN
jgi:4-hydroxy-tetrahydrodipicolinate synthase